MKVRDLIAVLEAQSSPNAEVVFEDDRCSKSYIEGGYIEAVFSGDYRVVLTPHSHQAEKGGF